MKKTTTAIAALAALVLGSTAFATMDIQKAYKKDKDPDAKCASCHKKATPKKEDAELNDLGKKVQAAKGKDGAIDWSKIPAVQKKN